MSSDENASEEHVLETLEITESLESVEETEARLWTEYTIALAHVQACWRLYEETWRKWVLTSLHDPVAGQVHEECRTMHKAADKAEKAAYNAWMHVAYPLHNLQYTPR